MRAAILWQKENLGLYSNMGFEDLYKGVGHNNGNLAFVHAIASHVGNETKFFPWHASPDTLRREADIIVIPCANQLGPHTDLGSMADRLETAGLPIVAIGLGAQADNTATDVQVSEGTLRWAQLLRKQAASSAPNIYTRGTYTTEQLDKLGIGDTIPGGCPSFFTNQQPKLGEKIWKNWSSTPLPRLISVAGGHQAWGRTRDIEHQLISMMMDPMSPGQYVVQSMGDMIKISRGEFDTIEEKVLANIHAHTVPHYTREEFKNWCINYARSFYDVPSWMDSLRRFDLTIGSRYHGVALALQAEKMGLTIAIDSRTEELCQNTGVPFIRAAECAAPLTRAKLKKMINFDPIAYDKIRSERAALYIDFLQKNQIKPAAFLQKIAEG
jgi:hypothetical protein